MPEETAAEREVRELHAFFVDWYCGRDASLERLRAALADDFRMIAPSGDRLDRERVIGMVADNREAYAEGGFDIAIEGVEVRQATETLVVLEYEEHQDRPGERDVRISTVAFRAEPSAPNGWAWVHLQETAADQ